ncbi:serine O-acetyltransferase [Entamoeba marina]
MDSYISKATNELFESISNDLPIFQARKQHPKKASFFELEQLQKIFFPSFFNPKKQQTKHHLSLELTLLMDHIHCSLSAYHEEDDGISECVEELLQELPTIRETVKTDLIAAYAGDPAATSIGLMIRCYPGIAASMIYRIAHVLYTHGDNCYSRELMETLHSHTGIDIHPGATIGSHFFIDHGVGVVIGETAVIGNWCRIYQQVTLGALHFQQDESGIFKRGIKRHPTIGDGVTIGAGAKVLGNISIGSNVKIGANCWVCEDIENDITVFISNHPAQMKKKSKPSTMDGDAVLQSLISSNETDNSSISNEMMLNVKMSPPRDVSPRPISYSLCYNNNI